MFWKAKKTAQQKNIELWRSRYNEYNDELCKLSLLQKIVGSLKHREELKIRIDSLMISRDNAGRRLIEAREDCLEYDNTEAAIWYNQY